MGPPRSIPSDQEAQKIKRDCAASILNLIPPSVAAALFATTDKVAQLGQIQDVLSCFDDTYMNKHFIYQIVDLVILRLAPELGERGVRELLDERAS